MADAYWKAYRAKIKDIKQGGADQRERLRHVSKKDKPFIVMYRWTNGGPFGRWHDWMKLGSYRTRKIAEQVIKDAQRKHDRYEMYIVEK